ncbi:hypothetical protein BDW02DRAFT_570607 [Decorospora gaudefroyi]|uniref:Secreted protein n=1 Tax=Decorospora gaudefroyi TaxID=184978 RepID=A0A6A5K5D8_9PLEO|nr:hypothetical protein BDW02DRAFT_570607 [Decorospora gaudefroyi]
MVICLCICLCALRSTSPSLSLAFRTRRAQKTLCGTPLHKMRHLGPAAGAMPARAITFLARA